MEMKMICKCFSSFCFCHNNCIFVTSNFSRSHKNQRLLNLEFAIVDNERDNRKNIEKTINSMGGTVTTTIHCNLAAVISNHKNIQKNSFLLKKAREYNVHVVSEQFLLDVVHTNDPIQSIIIKRSLGEWGSNVSSSN